MKKTFSKFVFSLLVVIMALSPFSLASAYDQTSAQSYLSSHANNPWSLMGLIALNSTNIPLDYLKNIQATSAIDNAAPILAIAAAGKDPRTFGSENLVLKLKSYQTQSQIGDASTVNDDIFGLLALVSAGEPVSDSVIVDAKNFIVQNQQVSGGWGFATAGGADSNITAAAIVALKTAGASAQGSEITRALNYLKTAQNGDGGFTYDPASQFGTQSDSSSTAWVLWALNALGIDQAAWSKNGHTPVEYLASTQTQSGFFEWQAGSGENSFSPVNTAYAIIALEGKSLPLNPKPVTNKEFTFRIEGSQDTICEGKTQGPSALEVIKNASAICGFSYHIKDTSFGPYLDQINGDRAAGTAGWLYWVNNNLPQVGAGDYRLLDNDEVLWAFGEFDVKPIKLSVSPLQINSGQTAEALVEYRDNAGWQALSGANVIAGALNFTSPADGKTQISGADGYYQVFAEKPGFVRSPKILLQIGTPASLSVNLSVNVQASGIQGTSTPPAISFMVEPSSLDFGSLRQGQSASKTLKLKNTGSSNLRFESQVVQGQLFKDNLKLDGKLWQLFKKDIAAGQNSDVQAGFTVPSGTGAGQQTGTLIFWASPK